MLSEPQNNALKYATAARIGDGYYCEVQYLGNTRATLNALVKSGHLEHAGGNRYGLTEKGEQARDILVNHTCQKCGGRTHSQEAACIHCGELKQWAKDDIAAGVEPQAFP